MSHRTAPLETDKLPPGIPYIIGNEAAERFSFYGMRTILVVFMVQYLHLMDGRGGLPMANNQAVEYYHQFTSWVYFTPLLGALLADVFLGKYRTILLLSVVYCFGHLALACMGSYGESPRWLFAGLLLICIGSGGIKPCVSAHVGDQFGRSNHHLLSKIFNWFYFSINFGAMFSAFVSPWLLQYWGPHWAFGVPGVLMALATLVFWLGRDKFVHIPPAGFGFLKEAFSREGVVALGKLIPLFTFIAVFWSLYDQTGSSWVLQAEQMKLKFLGITWLESQIQGVNSILILVYIPLFNYIIYPWINRFYPLTPLRKIGLGMILMTASFALTTVIQTWIDAGQRPSVGWQIAAYGIITASEILVSIVGLEFAYTQSPKAMKSWIMSLFLLSVWLGNQFTAQVNHFISIPSPAEVQFEQATANLPADWRTSPRTIVLPGYDANNPNDDLVARCKLGTLDAIEIPGRSIFLTAASSIESAAAEHFSSKEAGMKLMKDTKDPWGNPLRYDLIDSAHARISSAGPDRSIGTPWDVGIMISRDSANPPPDMDTWLGRRQKELGVEVKTTPSGFTRTEFCGGQSKLEGAAYFRFFTWLVLAATFAYIPFAWIYRPRSYLHD